MKLGTSPTHRLFNLTGILCILQNKRLVKPGIGGSVGRQILG